jgi:hypothetical protein
VKKITLSLPDHVYRQARVKAAERDTSLNTLVREFLIELTGKGTDFERRKRLQDEAIASIKSFRAGDRLSRGEIHDRAAVPFRKR